ncbi:hypothetical protein VTJ04DRAFT_9420 [Mycothermus thermophilus]|uniref:uncharacterized protein n=1 Tax=Humicola insolens TaxID=85995 RepID=UPI0037421DBB
MFKPFASPQQPQSGTVISVIRLSNPYLATHALGFALDNIVTKFDDPIPSRPSIPAPNHLLFRPNVRREQNAKRHGRYTTPHGDETVRGNDVGGIKQYPYSYTPSEQIIHLWVAILRHPSRPKDSQGVAWLAMM